MSEGPTRGHGLLEEFLSKKRSKKALALLKNSERGSLLDIGCGTRPRMLMEAPFDIRCGIEQFAPVIPAGSRVNAVVADVGSCRHLPFEDDQFDAVTMLAVLEHLPPPRLVTVLSETLRVLRPTGVLVLTTPAAWTEGLLRFMARLNLVSKEEIDEHAEQYSVTQIREMLEKAGFPGEKVRTGYFELGANIWATATK